MSVNALTENYSWNSQHDGPTGLERGTQSASSIIINLPGLYEINLGIIFPNALFSLAGKAQPQIRIVINGQIKAILDENQLTTQVNRFGNLNQIDENIKIFDGSEDRRGIGPDSARGLNMDMPKQLG